MRESGCRPEVAERIVAILMEDAGVGDLFGGGGRPAPELRRGDGETPPQSPSPTPQQPDPLQARRDRARALFQAGKNLTEIGEELGISPSTVHRDLEGFRSPPNPLLHGPEQIEKRRARVAELFHQGLTYGRIAAELGVSPTLVKLDVKAVYGGRPPARKRGRPRKRREDAA